MIRVSGASKDPRHDGDQDRDAASHHNDQEDIVDGIA